MKTDAFRGIKQLSSLEDKLTSLIESKQKEMSKLLEGKRILDIGCGIGTYAKKFLEEGFEVIGIDASEECLKNARNACNAIFFKEDICELKRLKNYRNYFDSVFLLDVLEHIKDEQRALRNIKLLLKKRGVLVLSVPAFHFLFSKHDLAIGHFRRYALAEIRNKLENAGFKVEEAYYWNLPGFFAWFLFCKLLGKDPTEVISPRVDEFYRLWFRIERIIRVPVGLTIIVKARKI